MTSVLKPSIPRRHDLDALRAIAMLLGILLHGAISFIEMPLGAWPVQDVRQHEGFSVFMSAIHGFRMPLFFLISGFFTAMLWRKRGLKNLLKHRFKRIFLPLALGMFTIIPAVWVVIIGVSAGANPKANVSASVESSIWAAARTGKVDALAEHLENDGKVNALDPATGAPPIAMAAWSGHDDAIRLLLERGAEVDKRSRDGSTALIGAAFFGRSETVQLLIDHGADPNEKNDKGERAWDTLKAPWDVTQWIAGLVQVQVNESELNAGRKEVANILTRAGGANQEEAQDASAAVDVAAGNDQGLDGLITFLVMFPLFHHLWFLWFLCLLVVAFAIYASALDALKVKQLPSWLVVSPLRYVWLIPLTILPQAAMGLMYPNFGPDTSVGLIPMPQILFYYAIFFFFGAMYFDSDDTSGRIGRGWQILLPVSLLVIFPIGYEFTTGGFGFRDKWVDPEYHRQISVVLQVIYVWLMTFSLMGMFRSLFSTESKTMRYVSDSSYWLYLIHLPLIMIAQFMVRHWQLPAIVKCALICVMVSSLLLLSYQLFVRYTPIGTLLNGPRQKPEPAPVATTLVDPPVA